MARSFLLLCLLLLINSYYHLGHCDEEISDDEILSSDEIVLTDDEILSDDAVLTSDEEILSDEELISDEELLSDDSELTSNDEELTSNDEEVTSNDEEVTSNDSELSSQEEGGGNDNGFNKKKMEVFGSDKQIADEKKEVEQEMAMGRKQEKADSSFNKKKMEVFGSDKSIPVAPDAEVTDDAGVEDAYGGLKEEGLIALVVIGGLSIITIISAIICCLRKKHLNKHESSDKNTTDYGTMQNNVQINTV